MTRINSRKSWWLLFSATALCILSTILFSEYAGDDLANSNIGGAVIKGDFASLFSAARCNAIDWFHRGRAYVLSPFLCYYVHGICNQICYLYAYKAYLAIFTLINLLLFMRIISRLSGNPLLGRWCAVCYLALLPIQFQYESALWAYHGIMHAVMFFAFLAILCMIKTIDAQSPYLKFAAIFSCLLFDAFALSIYEPALIIGPVLWIVYVARRKTVGAKRIAWMAFVLSIPTAAFLGITFWAQKNATDAYPGVAFSFDPFAITATFVNQLSSVVPGLYSILSILIGRTHLHYLTLGGCVWILVTVVVYCGLLTISKPRSLSTSGEALANSQFRPWTLWIVGAILLLFPCFLMSISERYQSDLVFSRGWLPTYMSTFGLAILFALLALRKRAVATVILILCVFLGAFSAQLAIGRPHTSGHLKRCALVAAAHDGTLRRTRPLSFGMSESDATEIDPLGKHNGVANLLSYLTGEKVEVFPENAIGSSSNAIQRLSF